MEYKHTTVLLDEAVEHLVHNPDGVYIDGTFGRGGHSALILKKLSPKGKLIAIDKDLTAINAAQNNPIFANDDRFSIIHQSFSAINNDIDSRNIPNVVDGVLLDLGISSPQIDDGSRGFSFMRNGPLDMRMNISAGQPLSTVLQDINEQELADIIYKYGEEKQAKRVAAQIKSYTTQKPILDTHTLANIVASVVYKKSAQHPATRTFQALRIYINQELTDLERMLENLPNIMATNAKAVVISFHSLEDRLVKTAFNLLCKPIENKNIPRHILQLQAPQDVDFKLCGKYKPSEIEIDHNPRSRSAIMRVMQKIR
jgi:16S rRNA (cytosine1402-N4)-methyltransferase